MVSESQKRAIRKYRMSHRDYINELERNRYAKKAIMPFKREVKQLMAIEIN